MGPSTFIRTREYLDHVAATFAHRPVAVRRSRHALPKLRAGLMPGGERRPVHMLPCPNAGHKPHAAFSGRRIVLAIDPTSTTTITPPRSADRESVTAGHRHESVLCTHRRCPTGSWCGCARWRSGTSSEHPITWSSMSGPHASGGPTAICPAAHVAKRLGGFLAEHRGIDLAAEFAAPSRCRYRRSRCLLYHAARRRCPDSEPQKNSKSSWKSLLSCAIVQWLSSLTYWPAAPLR